MTSESVLRTYASAAIPYLQECGRVISSRELFAPKSGSPLRLLDETTRCHASQHVETALIVAIEHACVAARLSQGDAPIYVIATLARSVIDASAIAVGLLRPGTREELVSRVATLELQSLFGDHGVRTPLGGSADEAFRGPDHRAAKAAVLAWAGPFGFERSGRKVAGYQEAVRNVGEYLGAGDLESAWQVLSGVAHGKKWATGAIAVPLEEAVDDPGGRHLGIGPNPEGLARIQALALFVLGAATTMWNRAATGSADGPFPALHPALAMLAGAPTKQPDSFEW